MASRLIIWGAGGHGKVVAEIARAAHGFTSLVFVDDSADRHRTVVAGSAVVGTLADIQREPGDQVVVAIGDNALRAEAYVRCRHLGFRMATVIHPTAVVSPTAVLADGTVVAPLVVINADARVGHNCIINTAAIVEHDCVIADHVHVSPRVAISGAAHVGKFSHLGLGAVVLPGVHIGANSTLGAGAVAVADVPDDVIALGVPARITVRRSSQLGLADGR